MINFDKHIRNFLYEQDFYIVPGLGAFIASFSKASISDNGELIEPIKTFEFNGLLNTDDGNKFFNYLIRQENVPKSEISIQLKDFLFDLKSKLNTNQKVVLANVCSLHKSDEGILMGTFDRDINFYVKPDFQEQESLGVDSAMQEFGAGTGDNSEEVDEVYEEYESDQKWKKYLLYGVPILLLAIAFYYLFYVKSPSENSIVDENNGEIILDEMDSTVLEPAALLPADNAEEGSYDVAAGLFREKTNADNLLERMIAAGFEAKIKMVNGMRRVYVSVNTIDQAEAMAKRIEKFTGDKSVYFDKNGRGNK